MDVQSTVHPPECTSDLVCRFSSGQWELSDSLTHHCNTAMHAILPMYEWYEGFPVTVPARMPCRLLVRERFMSASGTGG